MALKSLFNEVEFLAQYPMVGAAISDSTGPVPGYLFGEINAITFVENGKNCKPLMSFLISHLKSEQPIVCIKILKLLLYLVKNGHTQMTDEVKLHEVPLKEARRFNGPPDEVHGASFYQAVRKMAKELLDLIYSENKDMADKNLYLEQTSLAGYGSDASVKKMPGFGHSIKQEKSVSDVVSDSFSTFVEKLFPSPDKEKAPQATSHLSDTLPKYKPIIVEKSQPIQEHSIPAQPSFKTLPTPIQKSQRKVKVHRPGRAGGGWESSSDEEEYEDSPVHEVESCKESTISTESVEDSNQFVQCSTEVSDEGKIVEEFTINKPLTDLNYADILSICNKCCVLNRDEILSLLLKKLIDTEELVQLRALIFIEYLLFHDVISLESLTKVALPHFKEFLEENSDLKSSVKLKILKIQANIEALNKKFLKKMPLKEVPENICKS